MLVFDIETGPLPDDSLKRSFECPPPPQWVDFDPESVKYGNTTDPEKRARKLADERDKHNAAQRRRIDGYEQEKQAAWDAHKRDAGLSAATGRVLAVGLLHSGYDHERGLRVEVIGWEDERKLINQIWRDFSSESQSGSYHCKIAGHNIIEFDLPFLVRRSWILGISVPRWVRDGRYWSRSFFDTRELWQLGQRQVKSSLNHVCQALGIPGKLDGVDGSQFAKLWATDKKKAEEYLRQDVLCTAAAAEILLSEDPFSPRAMLLGEWIYEQQNKGQQQPEPAGGTQTEASGETTIEVEDDDIF